MEAELAVLVRGRARAGQLCAISADTFEGIVLEHQRRIHRILLALAFVTCELEHCALRFGARVCLEKPIPRPALEAILARELPPGLEVRRIARDEARMLPR